MRLDILDDTPFDGTISGSERLKSLKRVVLGNPRKAPRRIIGLLIFALILALVVGVFHLARTTAESSGSSYWLVSLVSDIFGTLWVAVPVAIYIYYQSLGRRRTRYAAAAAEKTGWLTDSVKQLSDAVRSTDHSSRLIITSDDEFRTIRESVDAALRGEPHALESVDYYGRGRPSEDVSAAPKEPKPLPDGDVAEAIVFSDEEGDSPTLSAREQAWLFVSGRGERTRRGSILHAFVATVKRTIDVTLTAAETVWNGLRAVRSVLPRHRGQPDDTVNDTDTANGNGTADDEVPWRVRFAEEVKHFTLDFTAGYRSDDVTWRFALPAGVTFVTLALAFRLWVHPIAYFVFAGASILVGLAVFWNTKRARSKRLSSYRSPGERDHWNDVGGLVKTVETPDVTAYVGFMAGRTYATYDREEFLDEVSLRLWQCTHDKHVSPSILEQYARNLGTMKPNLQGHRENIERPEIQRRIKRVVQETEDQVVEKAELAYRVIEPVDETVKFEQELGHDPRLVAEEYKWLVEEGCVLAEMDVSMPNASGEDTDLTLVYPSEKNRLPDVQQVHSRLSDRFHGLQGAPHYRLPEVDPATHINPFTPGAEVWADGDLPASGPNGHVSLSD